MEEPDAAPSVEVALVPENRHRGPVADVLEARLAPGGSPLGCLELSGRLLLWDPADRDAPPAALDGTYRDFRWEEPGGSGGPRLLAVGSDWDLTLLEAEPLREVHRVPASSLLDRVRDQDQGVCELQAVCVLSFAAGRCSLLLNHAWLLQLALAPPPAATCRPLGLPGAAAPTLCVCGETLFILSDAGVISVFDMSDGLPLATVDLRTYQTYQTYQTPESTEEDLPRPPPWTSSPFRLLQVSADLSTAVAVTRSHAAVAVDLDHYFTLFPDHLLRPPRPSGPAPRPPPPADQDASASSASRLAPLRAGLRTDRSWGARLASLRGRARPDRADPPGARRAPWAPGPPPLCARSRAPPGGASVTFSAPEASAPRLLAVTGFSALMTFVSDGNGQTTVALWNLSSGALSYHRARGDAAPVEPCGATHQRLLLKKEGLVQVVFSVSQEELLSRLMLFGSAATVDAVCHLNGWGRCPVPIHALQAGLKNRQLDTVDFYLKSKENVLSALTGLAEDGRTAPPAPGLREAVEELRPALDLLCAAIRDSNSDAQSHQFSEQLLNVTLNFVNTQIRHILCNTPHEDAVARSCVDVLDPYVAELRTYLKRQPCPPGGAARLQGSPTPDRWELLPPEEVVYQSILTNQMPRAQAVLRGRGLDEQRLEVLRARGLQQVVRLLQNQDLLTATKMLTNMGFSVKQQLHTICLHTDDKNLRLFVVEALSQQGCFPLEEQQSVDFLQEMEDLVSLAPARAPGPAQAPPSLCRAGGSWSLEEEGVSAGEGREELWRRLRLDWIRTWDQDSQVCVLLSRREHTEVSRCEPQMLWRYLTSLHDRRRVWEWVGSGAPCWPELTPELVERHSACSSFMKESVLDLLARRGAFVPEELADLERLLWRLAQGEGLMVPRLGPSPGRDLHGLFVPFCVERGLRFLLYSYLEHYRLTPRNCPPLAPRCLSQGPAWLEMLVKVQEISRDLTDPGLVFHASLTSAQVLLPGNQPSLSGLLLEGHSLLALATIMFSPGGMDQVVLQSERSGPAETPLDPQLLKMALATHPKLKAALFPAAPRGSGSPSDISVYHLLQSLHPLDPSKLFGWQAANTLNSAETTEPPHFSSPPLVRRLALVEHLDHLYFLGRGRPAFAFATFLLQQLSGCGDVPALLRSALQQVSRLALQSFHVASLTAAAVCFCELLGICSLRLRVNLKVLNTILQHGEQHTTHTLGCKAVQLAEAEPGAAEDLIGWLEAAVSEDLEQRGVSRWSYEEVQEWALPVHFCQLHGLKLSSVYPALCARHGRFAHFLLFVQLHSFPPQQVRSLAAGFSPALRGHLSLAFQDLKDSGQRGFRGPEEPPKELFQVLLRSQEEASPCGFLLEQALLQLCPPLAVLAACQQGAEPVACLCVWVLTAVDEVAAREATSHLPEAPRHHVWTLHDLSIIWKTLLGRGLVRPLLRGFQLFHRDCPLVLVLKMFELCCDHRNFPAAKDRLLDFQRTLLALRSGDAAPPGGLPLQWLESQASVLLVALLQRCSSPFDLHRLLQLLADIDALLKADGPDFKKLGQLSRLLQGSEVRVPPGLLCCASPSDQRREFQATVEALQARGLYEQARQVALLGGLPVHSLLLRQLLQEASSQRAKRQWRQLETRLAFWRRCHERMKAEGTDAASASRFFLSQAEPQACQVPELPRLQERCALLALAADWLAGRRPPPPDHLERLEGLEKRLWECRLRQHLLTISVETESVFKPPAVVTAESGSYDALMKEFSFSAIADLNTEACLSLDGVPGPQEARGPEEPRGPEGALSPEERGVLAAMVGRLLDQGAVHEASRLCRYFCLFHPDLWLVLRCRALASDPTLTHTRHEPSDGSTGQSLLILPQPEDQVAAELQRLSDRCRHGNNYCKQVVSLYQLAEELQSSFVQLSGEAPSSVLEKLLLSEEAERFRKARSFIKVQALPADAVAGLLAAAVVRGLRAHDREAHPERRVYRPEEGRDSLLQLVKLCDDPGLVGVKLMESISHVPLRELSCIVELLIVAHECFSLTCNMEGIVRVLQAARHLSHAHLAPAEHYGLLVRLLTGIGRYDEMTYILDLLHHNHRFEMLLRKSVDTPRGQSSSLRTALLDYIRRFLPADSEKHNMVALCFSMRREIGENHEMAARTQLKIIESQPWVVTPELKTSLVNVLALLKDAAESFAKDSCVRQASRCVRLAKLVSLQLHLLSRGPEVRLLSLSPAQLQEALLLLPRCLQALVVSEAYGFGPDWAELVYHKVVVGGDFVYLEELRGLRPLTPGFFADVLGRLDGVPGGGVAVNVKRLLTFCEDVYGRYRLAYQLRLPDLTKTLLQDADTSAYLSDRLAG